MKPSQLAAKLRQIATTIDNSKQPDRTLVARDLKKVLAAVNAPDAALDLSQYACNWDGHEGLSIDEEWPEAESIIRAAWDVGYRFAVIDSSLMLFQDSVEPSDDGSPGVMYHDDPSGGVEELLEWAKSILYNAGLIQYDTDSDEYTSPKN